jgi:hypothetical protein
MGKVNPVGQKDGFSPLSGILLLQRRRDDEEQVCLRLNGSLQRSVFGEQNSVIV